MKEMYKNDLVELAREKYGIDVPSKATKAQIIKMIDDCCETAEPEHEIETELKDLIEKGLSICIAPPVYQLFYRGRTVTGNISQPFSNIRRDAERLMG